MERLVKGDVVVLPFPYTDLSGAKKRPAVVIAALKENNVILAQITTVHRRDKDSISLTKRDFATGSLSHDSLITTSLIFTSDSSRISYKVGALTNLKIKQIEQKLCEIFTR
ncbi:type II toxin-antitoxin system PemK/MazF family toxin [Candidatus Pacearchaeota archaeon]|nr:type II toxin-antitoxin system PemK/MazF family toxin [Candidatus Pacearchaeota archaeon]